MLTLSDIYNNIKNPLNDDSTLTKIIETYAECERKNGRFYDYIMNVTSDEKVNTRKWFPKDADTINVWMYETWKENIINMTQEQFQEFYGHKGRYDDDEFIELKKYLKSLDDISTTDEVEEILHEPHGNKLLDEAIKKYTYEQTSQSGLADKWIYINSRKLAEKNTAPIKHRLYLNTDSVLTRPFLGELLSEFTQRHLEYFLKYSENGGRDDTIVIYATDENLPEYIEILREKYNKIQEVKDTQEGYDEIYNIYQPPIMTGKIDGWIGYGSEPELDENGKATSYNSVRSRLMAEAISSASQEWILENLNTIIPYNGKNVKFSEYFSEQIVSLYIKKAKEKLPFTSSKYKNQPEVIENAKIKNNLITSVNVSIAQEIEEISEGKTATKDIIELDYGNGTIIPFTRKDVENAINRLSAQIVQRDPSFLDRVRTKVKSKCNEYGVDKESFCFDTSVVNRFKNMQVPTKTITLDDCISKIKGLDPSKLKEAYKLMEMLELGELGIETKEEIN